MIGKAVKALDHLWFEQVSPASIAVFRIFVGIMSLLTAILMLPDLYALFGTQAIVPLEVVEKWWNYTKLFSLINAAPNSNEIVMFCWVMWVYFSVTLIVGWHCRISAAMLFLMMASFHHRNPFIVNSGDTLLRLFCFLLIFSAAGAKYSLDAKFEKQPDTAPVWATRLIQFQLIGMYAQAFFAKVIGQTWQDGTALYYILKLEDYQRFPLPIIPDHLWMLNLATWGTLIIEFALFALIWHRPLRYYILSAGVALHLGIDYAMNIPMFEWITMAGYLVFVDPKDMERAVNWVTSRFTRKPAQAQVSTPSPMLELQK